MYSPQTWYFLLPMNTCGLAEGSFEDLHYPDSEVELSRMPFSQAAWRSAIDKFGRRLPPFGSESMHRRFQGDTRCSARLIATRFSRSSASTATHRLVKFRAASCRTGAGRDLQNGAESPHFRTAYRPSTSQSGITAETTGIREVCPVPVDAGQGSPDAKCMAKNTRNSFIQPGA